MFQRYLAFIWLLLAGAVAWAVGTPAGTEITNQAQATYTDTSGTPQTSVSEEITTTVLAVYDFIITPDGTEGAPGQTDLADPGEDVTFVYTVTNQGNASDTIDLTPVQSSTDDFDLENLRFYEDVDGDGTLSPGDTEITAVEDLAPDESRQTLVVGTVPAGTAEDDVSNLNLIGESTGAPGTADGDNWAQAVAEEGPLPGVDIGNGDGDPTTAPSNTPETLTTTAGTPVSYPLELTNTGNLPDTFELTPDVPAGWTAEIFPDTDCDGTADGSAVTTSGALEPGANACFVVSVTPPADAAPGDTPVPVTATSQNDPALSDSITNTVTVEEEPAPGVNIGNGDENPATEPSDTPVTFTTTPGTLVTYPLELTNTGNTEDTFDLTVPNLPAGWTAEILPDTNCDGVADGTAVTTTGELAVGANVCFVVSVTPPADAAPGDTPVTVTATSQNDPTVSDGITNTLTVEEAPAPGVNIGNGDGNPATEPSDAPETFPTTAGVPVSYPLEVANTGNEPDTFDLALPDVPVGWTAEIFPDTNCDGVADGITPIADTGELQPGENACFVVTVTPPVDATPGDTPVTVTATSQSDPSVSDSITNTITVEGEEPTPGVGLGNGDEDPASPPSNTPITLTAEPGAPLSYPLELTNTGNEPDTFDLTPDVPTGWTTQIFPDTDCDGTPDGAALTDTGELAAGENACFVVTVTPPADAVPGDSPVTVTATSQNDPSVSDSITNTVTIEGDEPAPGVNLGNGDEDPNSAPSDTPSR